MPLDDSVQSLHWLQKHGLKLKQLSSSQQRSLPSSQDGKSTNVFFMLVLTSFLLLWVGSVLASPGSSRFF